MPGGTHEHTAGERVGEVQAGCSTKRAGLGKEGGRDGGRRGEQVLAVDRVRRRVSAIGSQRTANRIPGVTRVRPEIGGGLGRLGGSVGEKDGSARCDGGWNR